MKTTYRKIGVQERDSTLRHLHTGRGRYRFGKFRGGDPVEFEGSRWLIYDADADASTTAGFTLLLISPDLSTFARDVCVEDVTLIRTIR